LQVVGRRVREHAANVLFAPGEQGKGQAGGGAQGISVRVRMAHDGHLGGTLHQGLKAVYALLLDYIHGQNVLRWQIYKRLLLLRNDFYNFVGSLENYKTLK
jgi:hypothetical protein